MFSRYLNIVIILDTVVIDIVNHDFSIITL